MPEAAYAGNAGNAGSGPPMYWMPAMSMRGDHAQTRRMPRMGKVPGSSQRNRVGRTMEVYAVRPQTAPLPDGTSIEALGAPIGLYMSRRPPGRESDRGRMTRELAESVAAPLSQAVQARELEFLQWAAFADGTPAQAGVPARLSENKYDAAHDRRLHQLLQRHGLDAPFPVEEAPVVPHTAASYEPMEGARPVPPASNAATGLLSPGKGSPFSASPPPPARAAGELLRVRPQPVRLPAPAAPVTPFDAHGRRRPSNTDQAAARLAPDYTQARWGGRDSLAPPGSTRSESGYIMRAYRESFAELTGGAVRMQAPRDYLGLTRPTDELLACMGMRMTGAADQPHRVYSG